ncbi:hypothetical protein PMAYCL1PPCAC_04509, partial [Pristionchus mayeri]
STQASFSPFFYDYSLKGLRTMALRLPIFEISAMKGPNVETTFGDVMIICKNEDIPFFTAVVNKDTDVIDTTAFNQAVDYAALSNQFDDDISNDDID